MIRTGGEAKWADLGDMSAACITRPDSCTDAGTLMVWIRRLDRSIGTKAGGALSTVTNINDGKSSGVQITLNTGLKMYV